ncbi:MAG: HD domain-containing protein [Bacteroidia bacterium]|nr:HD domain-containing protein [Bacteroidia bacterium]
MNFPAAKEFILDYLRKKLPKNLYFHGIHHTIGVYMDAQEIALHEGIDGHPLQILLTAALFHDSGFTEIYQGHEEKSVEIALQYLPGFGYSSEDIEQIAELILATRIPQNPKNFLSMILCDADLYYLGGEEFYPIGNTLFREYRDLGIVQDEKTWNEIQLNFLQSHAYFTPSAQKKRSATKERYLLEIQEKVSRHAA